MSKPKKQLSSAQLAARRKGGKIGGVARAQKLTAKERQQIAAQGGKAKALNKQKEQQKSERSRQAGKRSLITLTPLQRSKRARKAALARWKKSRN